MSIDLSNIKVGDLLLLPNRYGYGSLRPKHKIITVERMTATQLVCTGNVRVRRKDGMVIGTSRTYWHVEAATVEALAVVKRATEVFQASEVIDNLAKSIALTPGKVNHDALIAAANAYKNAL